MQRQLSRFMTAAALAVGLFGAAETARAGLVISSVVGGGPFAGANYVNFDELPPGKSSAASSTPQITAANTYDSSGNPIGTIGLTLTPDAKTITGSLSGQYAAPYISNSNGTYFGDNTVSGQDATTYITTGSDGAVAGAKVTLDFSSFGGQKYLGLLWGSVDSYNTLTFHYADGTTENLTGANVTTFANGDQGANGTYYVNILADKAFTSVDMTSSQYAFEFDNVAFAPVPEPSTVVLAISGLAFAGLNILRRRNRKDS